MSDARAARLLALLRERSYEKKRVVLASGKESDFFIDCKQTLLTAEGHALAGELLFDALARFPACEAVAGVELGGCPLASAVSLVSFQRGRPLPALYVRKQQKDHGSKRRVEGDKALRAGLPVVLLEDVITTGGSSLSAVTALAEVGAKVVGIAAVVDRDEGGRATIEASGLVFHALFTRADFPALRRVAAALFAARRGLARADAGRVVTKRVGPLQRSGPKRKTAPEGVAHATSGPPKRPEVG